MTDTTLKLNPALCLKVNEKFQRQLIKLAIGSIQQIEVDPGIIENIQSENYVSDDEFHDLIGMYTTIVKLFMQSNKQEFEEKLTSCGYTQQFLDSLPLKYENKDAITSDSYAVKSKVNLQHKIDISLNNEVLKRVVPPWVIIMLHHDSKDTTFSVDISTFHKLRYNIALLLKELNRLKNSNVIKK